MKSKYIAFIISTLLLLGVLIPTHQLLAQSNSSSDQQEPESVTLIDTFSNPFESLFGSLSIISRLLIYNPVIQNPPCSSANNSLCAPVVLTVAAILIVLLGLTLWLFGFRLIKRLLLLNSGVTAYLFAQLPSLNQSILIHNFRIILIVTLFIVIAIFIDKYTGAFWILMIGIIFGQATASFLNQPAFIAVFIGVGIGFLVSCLAPIKSSVGYFADGLMAFITALIGTLTPVTLLFAVAALIWYVLPFQNWLNNRESGICGGLFIIAVVGVGIWYGIKTFIWLFSLGFGYQIEQIKNENENENNKMFIVKREIITTFFLAITMFLVFSATPNTNLQVTQLSINQNNIVNTPLESWVQYQVFASNAIRPWYKYPWEVEQNTKIEYSIKRNDGVDARSCPNIECPVLQHFDAGILTVEGDVGFLGITQQANFLQEISDIDDSTQKTWFVFLDQYFRVVYVDTNDVQRRKLTTPIKTNL